VVRTPTALFWLRNPPVTSKGILDEVEAGQPGVAPLNSPPSKGVSEGLRSALVHGDTPPLDSECVTEVAGREDVDAEITGRRPLTKLNDRVSASCGFAVVVSPIVELGDGGSELDERLEDSGGELEVGLEEDDSELDAVE
jgi:hypothetical protein